MKLFYLYSSSVAMAACLVCGASPSFAATATGNFNAQIVIQGECIVASSNTLNFGTTGVLSVDIDQTTTFEVQCTTSTPYTVGLDSGAGVGATTLLRKMTSPSGTVDYQMFSDPSRSVNWGDDAGTDTVDGVGNGSPQQLTIYGRVVSQATPAPDTYIDTVTIEITY